MSNAHYPIGKIPASPDGAPRTGVLAALFLPTDKHGQVIKSALRTHIEWMLSCGIYGFLVEGSTGDFCKFTTTQRQHIFEEIAHIVNNRVPLLANVSALLPQEAIALGNTAKQLGYKGITLMTPWFYPLSQDDILAHLLACAEGIDLPAYLYNFPELTGLRIGPEIVAAFAQRARMAGFKQSGGEYDYHTELIRMGEQYHFAVLSGYDIRMPDVYRLGAKGTIGGLANIAPELMVPIYQSFFEDKSADTALLSERLQTIGRIIDQSAFPVSVGFGMQARGLDAGTPKIPLSQTTLAIGEKIIAELRACFAEWKLPLL